VEHRRRAWNSSADDGSLRFGVHGVQPGVTTAIPSSSAAFRIRPSYVHNRARSTPSRYAVAR
jgi:hypothetical protein